MKCYLTSIICLIYVGCGVDKNRSTESSNTNDIIKSSETAVTLDLESATNTRNYYVGYYGAIAWGQDYFLEVANHTNMIWIRELDNSSSVKAAKSIEILDKIKKNYPKTKAMLDVSPIFFNPNTFLLYADYEFRWNKYVENLARYNFNNQYGAFYALDEAYANGANKGIAYEKMQKQLELASALIKKSFPTIPLALSYTTSTYTLPIPNGFDWVGVDCYGNWDSCSGKSMPTYFTEIEKRLQANQKLIVFADANLQPQISQNEDDLINRFRKYYAFAQTHPKVAGIFPFIWQSVPSQNIIGMRDLSKAKAELTSLSKQFIEKIPILASPNGLTPIVLSRGIGCNDSQCIWLIVKDIESDFQVDIRTTKNTGYKVDWVYNKNRLNTKISPNGTYSCTFRVTEAEAIKELNSNGLRVWITNQTSKKWSTEFLIKK